MSLTPRLEIGDIEQLTGIPSDRLRYVLNEPILDGQEKMLSDDARRGRGKARRFGPVEAYFVSILALMMQAGLARPTARRAMQRLLEQARIRNADRKAALFAMLNLYTSAPAVKLQIAEGRYIRITADEGRRRPAAKSAAGATGNVPIREFGWLDIDDGTPAPTGYEPLATVTVELGRLAARLKEGG